MPKCHTEKFVLPQSYMMALWWASDDEIRELYLWPIRRYMSGGPNWLARLRGESLAEYFSEELMCEIVAAVILMPDVHWQRSKDQSDTFIAEKFEVEESAVRFRRIIDLVRA